MSRAQNQLSSRLSKPKEVVLPYFASKKARALKELKNRKVLNKTAEL